MTVTVRPSDATAEIHFQLEQVAAPRTGSELEVALAAPVRGTVHASDGVTELEVPTTGPGLYRLTLSGGVEVEPVSDLVVVAPR